MSIMKPRIMSPIISPIIGGSAPVPIAGFVPSYSSDLSIHIDPTLASTITAVGTAGTIIEDRANGLLFSGSFSTGTRTIGTELKNVLDFNGSQFIFNSSITPALTQPQTIFIVFEKDTTTTQVLFQGAGDLSSTAVAFYGSTNAFIRANTLVTIPAFISGVNTHAFVMNGSSSKYWENGNMSGTINPGTIGIGGRLDIGRRSNDTLILDGCVGQLLVYNRVLTDIEVETVLTEIDTYFGL